MTYIAFFCWLSDNCFSSLTLPHSFFSLWLIPLFSLYFAVWLCRFSTWGGSDGLLSVFSDSASVTLVCLGGDLSHRLVQNGPFPPVSPSFVNLPVERLRPSESFRSCYRLWIAPDLECCWFYFFHGWCKSISFDSLPSCCSYFVFFLVLTRFLRVSYLSSCARVYVCVWTLIFFFFFHCPGWSFHLFSLLLCASASFLFSLPFFYFYWLIGKHCLSVATNCDCSSDKANKIKFGIPCFREAEPFVWITALIMIISGLIKFSEGVLVLCFI